jgi:aminoglycoside phosphotransferase (APT) family kinase protein
MKPSVGFSNETFVFTATCTERGHERREDLVLRVEPDFHIFPAYDLPQQFHIMRCLAGTDVPVPRVRWLEEDSAVLGRPFYVMDRVAGEVPSEVPPYHAAGVFADAAPEQRERMWWSGIETLARIHALDRKAIGLGFLGEPSLDEPPVRPQLDYYERMLDWAERPAEPQPTLRAALRWLRENEPQAANVGLCWGDSRLPNVLYQGTEVAAVLDWEMAFLGDPEADLAWWLFMDWFASGGYNVARLEGMPGREETIARYEKLTGEPVHNLFYNEVFAGFRFGVIMVRVVAMMVHRGLPLPVPDFASNNPATRKLAEMLAERPPS